MRFVLLCAVFACSGTPAPAPQVRPAQQPVAVVTDASLPPAADAPPRWIGVFFAQASSTIEQVIASSPADRAGLRRGDRIVTFGGAPVTSGRDVIAEVAKHHARQTVDVVVDRGGARLTRPLTIEVRPELEQVQRTQLMDKPAPAIALRTLANTPVDLASLKGRVVIVDFWATWCGPCEESIPLLQRWHKQLGPKGLTIVGISDEDPGDVSAFLVDHKIDYTIALDPSRSAWRAYLIQAVPTTIVIDKQGIVRFIEVGLGDGSEVEAVISHLLK